MFSRNWREWLSRFLPAELLGLAGSYFGYLLCARLGLPPLAAAYGAAFGENVGYYGAVFGRDWFALPRAERRARRVAGNMLHDFGPAEVLDSLIVRPGGTLLAVSLFGEALGIGIGKVADDIVFYILAITFWVRRRARENAE